MKRSKEFYNYIRDNYGKMSIFKIASYLGIDRSTVCYHANRMGIYSKNRIKYTEHFMDEMNEYSAYILGLVYADGWLIDSCKYIIRNGVSHRVLVREVGIGLKTCDRGVLQDISDYIELENPIYVHSVEDKVQLQLHGAHIVKMFKLWGVKSRKSINGFGLPDIDDKYFRDFVRGYFDGDGTVSSKVYIGDSYYNGVAFKKSAEFLGNNRFLIELKKKLRCFGVNFSKVRKVKDKNCWVMGTQSFNGIQKLYNFMYMSKPNLYLTRKKKKFEEIKSYVGVSKERLKLTLVG